jgi:hypothetical protein
MSRGFLAVYVANLAELLIEVDKMKLTKIGQEIARLTTTNALTDLPYTPIRSSRAFDHP